MLDQITPVILTLNEEANIGRTLGQLTWARQIILVDSFSTDRTLEIASSFPQVRIVQRRFDSHSSQWNFAVAETGIGSEWTLALDADYFLTQGVLDELSRLRPGADTVGFRARFRLCVLGRPLRSTIYPPVTVLFRTRSGRYLQDGHTQRVVIDGLVRDLEQAILHDDQKSVSLWLEAQRRYSPLEAQKLRNAIWEECTWPDKVRRMRVIAPFAVFCYCYIWRLGILDGVPGIFYAFQRTIVEMLLSLRLLEEDFKQRS